MRTRAIDQLTTLLLLSLLPACSGSGGLDADSIRRIELPYGSTVCRVEMVGGDQDLQTGLDSLVRRVHHALDVDAVDGPLGRLNRSDSLRTDDDILLGALRSAYAGYRLTERHYDPVVDVVPKTSGTASGSLELIPTGVQPDVIPAPSAVRRPTLGMLHPAPWFSAPGTPPVPTVLRKERSDLKVDLSAIAPGVVADEVMSWLTRRGIRSCRVQVDGVSLARGSRPDGTPWTFAWNGVERAHAADPRGSAIVVLQRQAGAVPIAGRPVPVTDPRSGRTVDHELTTVMVMHPNAATASAMAFGLLVMGPDRAVGLAAQRNDFLVYLTYGHDDRSWASRNWPGEAMAKGVVPQEPEVVKGTDIPGQVIVSTGPRVPEAPTSSSTLVTPPTEKKIGPAQPMSTEDVVKLKQKAERERLQAIARMTPAQRDSMARALNER